MKKFGLIGHPVGHSLSAVMHNAVFESMGLDCSYEAFDVLSEDLEEFFSGVDLAGFNITIPHKVGVMEYLDRINDVAFRIGAVNAVRIYDDGKSFGYNTDGVGFLKSFEEAGVDLVGRKVLVLGAGGASRAILVSLKDVGAKIILSNRTKEKALKLNEDLGLGAEVVDFDSLDEVGGVDVVVNTTCVGMSPNIGVSPLDKNFLKKGMVVFDAVYNPLETRLIRDAREKGCKVISGVNMLVHQGAESLRIWLGIEPDVELMKSRVLERLRGDLYN